MVQIQEQYKPLINLIIKRLNTQFLSYPTILIIQIPRLNQDYKPPDNNLDQIDNVVFFVIVFLISL